MSEVHHFYFLAEKIVALKNADLDLRDKLIRSGQLIEGYNHEMAALHVANAEALDEIINDNGYPSMRKVGKEASEAAWLIIQHSIGLPSFMKKCAELLKESIENGDGNPVNLAYLTDRIAVFEGRLQLYGTQFDWNEKGEMLAQPYDDLILVNERRAALGLNSISEQTNIIKAQSTIENQGPPSDFTKRKEEYDKWRSTVGWIK